MSALMLSRLRSVPRGAKAGWGGNTIPELSDSFPSLGAGIKMGDLGETASRVEDDRRGRTRNGFSMSETSERVSPLWVRLCVGFGEVGVWPTITGAG